MICITCQILHEIVCIDLTCNGYVEFVLVLIQVELTQIECSKCIRSILNKTNTNLLHSNLIHSISRKNRMILRKLDPWLKNSSNRAPARQTTRFLFFRS